MKKIIICIMGIISLLSLSLSAYAGNNMFIDDNFDEVLMLNHWVDDTGRGSKQIETDGSNNYLAMTAIFKLKMFMRLSDFISQQI